MTLLDRQGYPSNKTPVTGAHFYYVKRSPFFNGNLSVCPFSENSSMRMAFLACKNFLFSVMPPNEVRIGIYNGKPYYVIPRHRRWRWESSTKQHFLLSPPRMPIAAAQRGKPWGNSLLSKMWNDLLKNQF